MASQPQFEDNFCNKTFSGMENRMDCTETHSSNGSMSDALTRSHV